MDELINDKPHLKLINIDCLLEKLGTVLKHIIQVNDGSIKLKDIEFESIIKHVSKCLTNVSLQMADIDCLKSVANNI